MSGAAGIHIDDQVEGTKKTNAKTAGRVLTPVSTLISRLLAVKLQFDVMGCVLRPVLPPRQPAHHIMPRHRTECVLIQRTDAETAGYITSTVDARDRPFILGASVQQPRSLLDAMMRSSSPSDAEDAWVAAAKLTTLDEAIRGACSASDFAAFEEKSKGFNTSDALRVARDLGIDVFWSEDSVRNREGWYRYRGGIDAAISRSVSIDLGHLDMREGSHSTRRTIACGPYADVLWTRTPATVLPDLEKFATEVLAAVGPDRWLAYNLADDVKGTGP